MKMNNVQIKPIFTRSRAVKAKTIDDLATGNHWEVFRKSNIEESSIFSVENGNIGKNIELLKDRNVEAWNTYEL